MPIGARGPKAFGGRTDELGMKVGQPMEPHGNFSPRSAVKHFIKAPGTQVFEEEKQLVAVIEGIEAARCRRVLTDLSILVLIPMGLDLIRLNLSLLRDGPPKTPGVSHLLGNLNVLHDDRPVLAPLQMDPRQGAVVVLKGLNQLDPTDVIGSGQFKNAGAY